MNELTKTNIRLHFDNLTKYFDTLEDLKNFIFDHTGKFNFQAEIFVKNNWQSVNY